MSVTGTSISLTLRQVKGSELTYAELDGNQSGLKTGIEGHSHDEFAASPGADDNYVTDAEKSALHDHTNKTTIDKITEAGNTPLWDGGAWPSSGGGGDMYKSVYDPDSDGIIAFAQLSGVAAALGADDNYVTDVEKAKLAGLSGTNTGDQDLSDYSLTSHNHALNNLTEKSYNSLTDKPAIPSISGLLDEAAHDLLDHTGLTGILALGTTNITAAAGDHGHAATYAAIAQTFYIGTTQVAINRTSAALTLAGITLTTPDIGTPSSGNLSNCTKDGTNGVGYLNVPQNSQSAAYTCVLADGGKHILHPSEDTTARTMTIPANSSVAYPIGTAITFVNQASAGIMTIAITTDTMRLAGAGTTGSRALAANGIATALKITSTEWLISGTGLT